MCSSDYVLTYTVDVLSTCEHMDHCAHLKYQIKE